MPVPIGDALGELLVSRGMEDALVLGQVSSCWERVVGAPMASQVLVRLVRNDELVVDVDHPAWATELELAGQSVLGRLASELGSTRLKRLSVRVRPRSSR